MGFTKRIVSKQSIWDTWNQGPGQVEKWLGKADALLSEDTFADQIIDQYYTNPSGVDDKIRKLLISS